MSNQTANIIVIKVCSESGEVVSGNLQKLVEASPAEFNDENIAALSDVEAIKKIYKLTSSPQHPAGKKAKAGELPPDSDMDRQELETTILGLLALRGAT